MSILTIGQAARYLEVCAATLRTWEKVGKLVPAGRTDGGRRYYTEDQVAQFKRDTPDYKYVRTEPKKQKESTSGEVEEV